MDCSNTSFISDILQNLNESAAPSGFEENGYQVVADLYGKFTDEVHSDPLGNLIAIRRCGRKSPKRLLIDTHMDEIGLIVTGYKGCFLRFRSIGGIDPRILPACEVNVLGRKILPGVITSPVYEPHADKAERNKAMRIENLFIDVGLPAKSLKEAVPVGTPVVFRHRTDLLGEDGIIGNALDDHACMAVVLYTLQKLKEKKLPCDLICVCSVREETNGSGAITAAFAEAPDAAVILDVTHGATPDSKTDEAFELGKGPAVGIGPNMSRKMTEELLKLADELDLPVQKEIMEGPSGTNAWEYQISRSGIPTAVLSVPLRYMHTPCEVVSLKDMDTAARLLAAYILGFGKGTAVNG